MTIGANLLVCNSQANPIHLRASEWALNSLLDSDFQQHDWRLVVVDNGSVCDGTAEWMARLPQRDHRISTIRMATNVGIPKARNAGYRQLMDGTDTDFVLEVHNDHLFPHDWLGPLVDMMEREAKLGLACPALITGGGQWFSPAARDLYNRPYPVARARLEAYAKSARKSQTKIGLQHPVLKRVAMLQQIGLYDEGFPGKTNFEDLDECFRAHRAGWHYWVIRQSVVFHHYHLTRLELSDCMGDYALNRQYMDRKWGADWTDWESKIFSPAVGAMYR